MYKQDIMDRSVAVGLLRDQFIKASFKHRVPFRFSDLLLDEDRVGVTDIDVNFSVKRVRIKPLRFFQEMHDTGIVDGEISDKIPVVEFLDRIYALKHEEAHVMRNKDIKRGKKDVLSVSVAYETLSSIHNDDYYHSSNHNENWNNCMHMVMELEAQKYAVQELYKYCLKLYEGREEYANGKALEVILNSKDFCFSNDYGNYYAALPSNDVTCDVIVKSLDEEIDKVLNTNMRSYVSKGYYETNLLSADYSLDNIQDKSTINDHLLYWFDNNIGLKNFDVSVFPDYFATSIDVDKFVLFAHESLESRMGRNSKIQASLKSIKCLKSDWVDLDDKVFIDMFQNEEPNHQFSFDKYKLKQDLERRLQTVQDNAEEKGLVSNEELDVESEVKL